MSATTLSREAPSATSVLGVLTRQRLVSLGRDLGVGLSASSEKAQLVETLLETTAADLDNCSRISGATS